MIIPVSHFTQMVLGETLNHYITRVHMLQKELNSVIYERTTATAKGKMRDDALFEKHKMLQESIANCQWLENRIMRVTMEAGVFPEDPHKNVIGCTEIFIRSDDIEVVTDLRVANMIYFRRTRCELFGGVDFKLLEGGMNGAWCNHSDALNPNWSSNT